MLSFCSCSQNSDTANICTREQVSKVHALWRGLFILVCVHGHLAVTRVLNEYRMVPAFIIIMLKILFKLLRIPLLGIIMSSLAMYFEIHHFPIPFYIIGGIITIGVIGHLLSGKASLTFFIGCMLVFYMCYDEIPFPSNFLYGSCIIVQAFSIMLCIKLIYLFFK